MTGNKVQPAAGGDTGRAAPEQAGDFDAPQPRRPQHQPAHASTFPRDYNAAHDLLSRNAARSGKVAFIDAASGAQLTYGELTDQAHRFANALRARGFEPETRVMIAMLDTLEWPVVFLGCILAGVVPVAANTLLTTKDFDFMLRDSRAQALFVSKPLLPTFEPLIGTVRTLKSLVDRRRHRRQFGRRLDRVGQRRGQRGLHLRRRSLLLALFQRLHRHAQGHGAPAQPPDPDGGAVRAAPCWASARTTSSFPRPSCSSPTAWATA